MSTERALGPFRVSPIGLGCMNVSHAYGSPPDRATAEAVLRRALDLGHSHFDTAALYGGGRNETLVGEVLSPHRDAFTLASKCGMTIEDGKRVIDGRPAKLRATCEAALRRLKTDVIDLYYLHRWDKSVPVEESVGALGDLVREGKIRAVGLSEVSAATLRRAHAEHPIVAVQTEYSLWTRNPEIAVLEACRELGVTFVAFSPLARGYLCGTLRDPAALPPGDIRHAMPRFSAENYPKNLALLDRFAAEAQALGCTPGQLALAWVLAQGDHIVAIPGTTSPAHVEENWRAQTVTLPADLLARLDALFAPTAIAGPRYTPANQADVDTEEF